MHKPTLTLVGTDSLSKVSGYGEFKDFVTFVNCLLIFAPCCHFVPSYFGSFSVKFDLLFTRVVHFQKI